MVVYHMVWLKTAAGTSAALVDAFVARAQELLPQIEGVRLVRAGTLP